MSGRSKTIQEIASAPKYRYDFAAGTFVLVEPASKAADSQQAMAEIREIWSAFVADFMAGVRVLPAWAKLQWSKR